MGFQCLELLDTGQLNLPIQGEPADWLRAVRAGKVSFGDWWNRSLELDAQLEAMEGDRSLPQGPDAGRIEPWVISTHRQLWDRRSSGGS